MILFPTRSEPHVAFVSKHRTGGRALLLSCALAAIALGTGCRQILNIEEREYQSSLADAGGNGSEETGAGDGAPDAGAGDGAAEGGGGGIGRCGGFAYDSSACAACMDERCCTEASGCKDAPVSTGCAQAAGCMLACAADDATCRSRCKEYYTSSAPLADLVACRASQCAEACGATCGALGFDAPSCDTCVGQSCCAAAAACAALPDCQLLSDCTAGCLSAGCPGECAMKYPAGVDAFAALGACTQQGGPCTDSCASGQAWQCLGKPPAWLAPTRFDDLTISLTIADFATDRPYVGATVKACGSLDPECANPSSTATSDQDGNVTLVVHPGPHGFDGYLDVSGGDNGSGTGIYHALWYPIPPYISSGWHGRVQFVSESDFQGLAAALGVTLLDSRGHLGLGANDCNFTVAAGVSFSVPSSSNDPAVTSYYFTQGGPTTSVDVTQASSGIGGFLNLPPRITLVSARVPALGDAGSLGSLNFIVRANTITLANFVPVPP